MLQDLINKDTPVNHPKIKSLLDNEEKFMEEIMTFTDKRLEKMITIINLQLPMAFEQKKFVESEVLYLFKQMLIQARLRKWEIEVETGIYEEDEKPKRNKKPKAEKKTETTSTFEQEEQTIEEENDKQEESASLKQLSLFNLDSE